MYVDFSFIEHTSVSDSQFRIMYHAFIFVLVGHQFRGWAIFVVSNVPLSSLLPSH